jgi:hypothetical protein
MGTVLRFILATLLGDLFARFPAPCAGDAATTHEGPRLLRPQRFTGRVEETLCTN